MRAFIKVDGTTLCTIDFDGKTEESLWKPAGEFVAKNQPKEPEDLVVETESGDTAVLRFVKEENGRVALSVRQSRNYIPLLHSLYKMKKMRKIDTETGVHRLYDICPNSMGDKTYDIGAQFGDTGGTNVGADAITGVYTLKEPFPSYMYWYKFYQLLQMGYKDYSDLMYDEHEEFERIEKLFGNSEEMETLEIPTNTTMRVYEFLKDQATARLRETMDIESWTLGAPPFGRRQINSAWKIWEKMKNAVTLQELNHYSEELIAVTNVSFKEKGKKGKVDISFFLIDDIKERQHLIDYWETLIKSMEAMLPAATKKGANEKIISPFGDVEMEMASKEDSANILKQFHAPSEMKYKVVKVQSYWSDRRFEEYCEKNNITDKRLFCHGSPTPNWTSIVRTGLLMEHENPYSAFGGGHYTARDLRKSLGYSSLHGSRWAHGRDTVGVIGIYETAYGKALKPAFHDIRDYTEDIKKGGYDCLDAVANISGFLGDEIVFYKDESLTLKYLIFISEDKACLEFLK